MAIPESVPKTAEGYLKYLSDQIDLAKDHWTHYGWAVSHAYATAYTQQVGALAKVKKAIEARLEFDHDLVSFGLSLLTVGIAGGVAGVIARKMIDKKAANGEMMIDALKQSLQRAQKATADEDISAISPTAKVSDEAFAPAGVTPEEYTTSLQEGISYYGALLGDLKNAVRYGDGPQSVRLGEAAVTLSSSGLTLSTQDAKRLTEMVLNSTFVRDRPPTDINGVDLIPKASLALWIGWAYARDLRYWQRARTEYRVNNPVYEEEFDWESVRLNLLLLKVPASAITVNGTEYLWMNRTKPKTGLDMWGFFEWVASPAASALLFDNSLPKDAKGFEAARKQMSSMQLTPGGWVRRAESSPIMVPDALKLKQPWTKAS